MNGAMHFQEAERLLDLSGKAALSEAPVLVAIAEVHATLSLVAATVWANLPYTLKAADGAELWREATS
jgi:hypothetical protein